MSTFPLRIGTPDGLLYEGEVSRLVCRTISGDLAILPRHCNYCTALGMGEAHIVLEDGVQVGLALCKAAVYWRPPGSGKKTSMHRERRLPENGRKPNWQKAVSATKNIESSRRNCKEHWFVSV